MPHPHLTRDEAISIHALREEGDPAPRPTIANSVLFLSTPSARRATGLIMPPPLAFWISIHALREEGDVQPVACKKP